MKFVFDVEQTYPSNVDNSDKSNLDKTGCILILL